MGDSLLSGQGAHAVDDHGLKLAEVMMRAHGAMAMDAMTPGKVELSLGLPWLQDQGQQQGVDWLCANLRGPRGKKLGLPRKLVQTGGVKLGLVGVVDLASAQPDVKKILGKLGFSSTSPEHAVRAQVRALRKQGAEVLVLLAHTGLERAQKIVEQVPGIHLVLVGGSGARLETPLQAGGAFLMEAGRRGRELGHLELRLGQGWGPESKLADDTARYAAYRQAKMVLAEMKQVMERGGSGDNFHNQLKLLEQRAQETIKNYQAQPATAAPHLLVASVLRLDDPVADNPAVKALVDAGKQAASGQDPNDSVPAPVPPPRPQGNTVAIPQAEVR